MSDLLDFVKRRLPRQRPPCMTDADMLAAYREHVPEDDHSCGCDGAIDDGCPWCTPERLVEFQQARVRARMGWSYEASLSADVTSM